MSIFIGFSFIVRYYENINELTKSEKQIKKMLGKSQWEAFELIEVIASNVSATAIILDKKGILRYDGPIESLTHHFMKTRNFKEWQMVFAFWYLELILGTFVLITYLISDPVYSII